MDLWETFGIDEGISELWQELGVSAGTAGPFQSRSYSRWFKNRRLKRRRQGLIRIAGISWKLVLC